MFLIQLQGTDKGRLQLCQKVQRAAQEGNVAPDGLAAGKAADGLIDHGLEDGSRQVFPGGAVVDQGLYIGFGENAASGRNGIKRAVALCILVQTGGVRLKKGSHLVNKRTCAAGTDTVHTLFDIAVFEVDDLCVFAAQFDGDVRLGSDLLKSGGDSYDFLYEGDLKVIGQGQAAGAGDHGMNSDIAQLFLRFGQQVVECFPDIRMMPPVIREHKRMGGIQNGDLDSCRTYINSKCIIC